MNQAAQLQIRHLYAHSSSAERQRLKQYLKPLLAAIQPDKRHNDPVPIGQILPDVLEAIRQRMQKAGICETMRKGAKRPKMGRAGFELNFTKSEQ